MQIAIEIKPEQIEQIIKQLDDRTRRKLIDKLIEDDFDRAVRKLRKNVKKNKISQAQIYKICEEVRQELYEKRRNRH